MSLLLRTTIPGRPRPQGSMTLARDPRSGREFARYAAPTVLHRNLAVAVLKAEWDGDVPLDAPVAVRCEFRFARPKSHYGTGRNAGVLKASAPQWMDGMPDADKLCRLCCDALVVAGVLADDSRVAVLRGSKVWADRDGTVVEVHAL